MALQNMSVWGSPAGECFMYYVYEDFDSANQSRWRGREVQGFNNTVDKWYTMYVLDTNNGASKAWILGPGQSFAEPIPPQYQNKDPQLYQWGANRIHPPA